MTDAGGDRMEASTPIKTDEKKPYEMILVILLISAAALSGVCGYLSADASTQAGDANDASIRAQNEALNNYNIANQNISNDLDKMIESDVHWVNALGYDTNCYVISVKMRENKSIYEFAYNQSAIAYDNLLNIGWGDPDLEFMYLSQQADWLSKYISSYQSYQSLSVIYYQSQQAMHMEYILAEYLVGNTNAAMNGNISYELYNATNQDPFWENFSAYENWTYQPYQDKLSESKVDALSAQQFDQDTKSYLLSTVMLGVAATIAAIDLSVETKTPRKSLMAVTAIIIVVAMIYAIVTMM